MRQQVALDGRILGGTERGPLQRRDPNAALSATGALIGSISDVVPRGATLQVGLAVPRNSSLPDYITPDIDIAGGLVLGSTFTGSEAPVCPRA